MFLNLCVFFNDFFILSFIRFYNSVEILLSSSETVLFNTSGISLLLCEDEMLFPH